MYPFKRILIPTDFSTASEWVFDDAVRIAGAAGAEIVILHIRHTRTSRPDELRYPADESVYEYAERIELEKLRDRVTGSNANVPTRLLVKKAPDPGAEISRTAAEVGADLIVMSTHARHHVAHLLIGSTTLGVITNAKVPLLAIRYGTKKQSTMSRIVVPVHPQQHSHAALDLAAAVAAGEHGEVLLVTICSDAERKTAEALLEQLAAPLTGVTASSTIVKGDAEEIEHEVARFAEKSGADSLFVNAADSPSQLKLDIIRHAPVPVMIVPA